MPLAFHNVQILTFVLIGYTLMGIINFHDCILGLSYSSQVYPRNEEIKKWENYKTKPFLVPSNNLYPTWCASLFLYYVRCVNFKV